MNNLKKLILLSIVFVSLSLSIKAQWTQYLADTNIYIKNISIANDSVIWISGTNGVRHFNYTTNGGKNWITKNYPSGFSAFIGGLSALSATTAFLIVSADTSKGVYKTTNSGGTWKKQTTAFNQNSSFPDFVYFWDQNNGVAVGDANPNFEIYTTNNGGNQWDSVPVSKMPPGNNEGTYNFNNSFRVLGNSFYFYTIGQSGGGLSRIFRSTDKGLNWNLIITPTDTSINSTGYDPVFDFKDENNGLWANYDRHSKIHKLYSTTDAGQHWTLIQTSGFINRISDLRYIPTLDAYMAAGDSLIYSTDNGNTWTPQPSFSQSNLASIDCTASGKIFLGGSGYIYSSTNYIGENLAIDHVNIIDSTHIDITFSLNIDLLSSQDSANYSVYYFLTGSTTTRLSIVSVTRDNSNNSVVHLVTKTAMPVKSIGVEVSNVMDSNHFPIINNSPASRAVGVYTGITRLPDMTFTIFPNPVSKLLNINNIPSKSSITIYDVYGKAILWKLAANSNEILDLSTIHSGVYILKIESSNGTTMKKFIKQ